MAAEMATQTGGSVLGAASGARPPILELDAEGRYHYRGPSEPDTASAPTPEPAPPWGSPAQLAAAWPLLTAGLPAPYVPSRAEEAAEMAEYVAALEAQAAKRHREAVML